MVNFYITRAVVPLLFLIVLTKKTKSTMLKCFTPLNCSRSFNFCWNVAFYVWVLKGSFCVLTGNGSNGWTVPLSWKSVYGPPPDMSIF